MTLLDPIGGQQQPVLGLGADVRVVQGQVSMPAVQQFSAGGLIESAWHAVAMVVVAEHGQGVARMEQMQPLIDEPPWP